MKTHIKRQYIITINFEYIRCLYKQQTGEKKSQDEICRAVLKEIGKCNDRYKTSHW